MFRNAYLENCQEICVFERHLFMTSAGYDAVLGFNLETDSFDWAIRIVTDGRVFGARRFDPNGDEGPLMVDKLRLNNVHCDTGGMYVSGTRTGALLRFGWQASHGIGGRLRRFTHGSSASRLPSPGLWRSPAALQC